MKSRHVSRSHRKWFDKRADATAQRRHIQEHGAHPAVRRQDWPAQHEHLHDLERVSE